MIVRLGKDTIIDSTEHPIIVEFTREEVELAKTLDYETNAIYAYPYETDEEMVEKWANQRLQEDPV